MIKEQLWNSPMGEEQRELIEQITSSVFARYFYGLFWALSFWIKLIPVNMVIWFFFFFSVIFNYTLPLWNGWIDMFNYDFSLPVRQSTEISRASTICIYHLNSKILRRFSLRYNLFEFAKQTNNNKKKTFIHNRKFFSVLLHCKIQWCNNLPDDGQWLVFDSVPHWCKFTLHC